MSELTDLEICKRIAEIEYGKAYIDSDDTGNFINLNHPSSDRGGEMYSPLADKALCFDLMVKYGVHFDKATDGEGWFNFWHSDGQLMSTQEKSNTPQRAICLAIIEKHKD